MLELYGTQTCPYTTELRDSLLWDEREFVEYDVERDADAKRRLLELCEGTTAVPVLVEDERVVQVGYNGRACYVTPA